MANRWLFAGGGADSLRVLAGTLSTSTSLSFRDASYCDHAVLADNSTRYAYDFTDASGAADSAVTGETLHVHFDVRMAAFSTTAANLIEVFDSSDQPWLALRNLGSPADTHVLCYNSGTGGSPVWTQVTADSAYIYTTRLTVDIWIALGSPHSVSWAVDGTSVGSGTFTQPSLTALSALHVRASGAADGGYTQVMATVGIPLIGAHVNYLKPTGAGSNSGMTGAYTAIDDTGIDDADSISSAIAGQRSTFAYSDIVALGGNEAVGDAFMFTRARNSGVSPANVKPVRRDSGGTDNVGSSFSGITTTYKNFLTRYSGLSETEVNASQFGVESAA